MSDSPPDGRPATFLGARMAQRLRELGISQSELARRVGTHQSTISALIRRGAKSSRHLLAIARELQTTAQYLSGEHDDLDSGPLMVRARPVTVALPSEPELARLFEELLEAAELSTRRRAKVMHLLAEGVPARVAKRHRAKVAHLLAQELLAKLGEVQQTIVSDRSKERAT